MLFQANNKAPHRQVGVLLDYIGTKRPVEAYCKLRNALIQTGQKHVVDQFLPELSEFNRKIIANMYDNSIHRLLS